MNIFMRAAFLQLVLLLALALIATCQVQPQTGQSVVRFPGNADTRDITPGPVEGVAGPKGSWLITGLQTGVLYDDNYGSTNVSRHPDFHYMVNPAIDWQRIGDRLISDLQYSPGLSISNHLRNRDVVNQAAGLKLDYKMFRHLRVGVHDAFRVTNDPFEITSISASTPRLLTGSNQLLLTPVAKRTTMTGGLDATYQLDQWSTVSVNGAFSQTHFGNSNGSNTLGNRLINSRTVNGRAFYIRRISRRQSLGAEYDFLDLRFKRGHQARTTAHSIFYFHQILLNPEMTLAIFGGPEFTRTQDQLALNLLGLVIDIPVSKKGVAGAGGLVFDYTAERNSVRVVASRRVGDGGGILGSVTATNGTFSFSRHLTPLWDGSLDASFDDARILNVTGAHARIDNLSAGINFSRKLSENFSAKLSYAHLNQKNAGILFSRIADHNRASISLDYHFTHILGR